MKPTPLLKIAFLSLSLPLAATAAADRENPEYYGDIVRLDAADPDADLDHRLEEGALLLNRRSDLALLLIPYDRPDTRSGAGSPPRARIPRLKATPTMDVAIPLTGLDLVHSGRSLSKGHDGSGVVVGFCDTGFDPGHLNFRDAEGNCRVKRMTVYRESEGLRTVYSTEEEILAAGTDNADMWHATHVAGILAGSHAVEGIPEVAEGSRIIGAAPGAEIVATMSELTDVGLLAGVEDIIAYAKEVGKPAVINLSVGSYLGPHDGTSLFCQYLDLCAEEAIICISAGNEGSKTNHQTSTRASTDEPMRVRLAGSDWVNFTLYGQTDIYSADATPFSIALRISDSVLDTSESLLYQTAPLPLAWDTPVVISSTEMAEVDGWIHDPEFARWFEGEVYVEGGIDPENGRWCARVMYDCTTEEVYSDEKPWARHRLEIVVAPESPVRLDAFADGQHSWIANWLGNPTPPGNSISISDLATGHRTVSVGMYCTGQTSQMMNGDWSWTEFQTPFKVTTRSSYGTLPDGRVTPLTVGPGMVVVASMSGPHAAEHGTDECSIRVEDSDGATHWWAPMSGTSMSSPFVAGSIATWLQANPSLTWSDVQRIILDNNTLPATEDALTNPRYGRGLFNPYTGFLKALRMAGTTGVVSETCGLALHCSRGAISIINPSGADTLLEVFTMHGMSVASLLLPSSHFHELELSELTEGQTGPFIIRASSPGMSPATAKMF